MDIPIKARPKVARLAPEDEAVPLPRDRRHASIRLLGSLWEAMAGLSLQDIENLSVELEFQIDEEDLESIDLVYAQLGALVREGRTAASDVRYDALMSRLHQLQEAEAVELERYFEQHRPLPRGSGAAAITRADELLAEYEDSPTPHGSSK